MSLEDFEKFAINTEMEVVFPKEIFSEPAESKENLNELEGMLNNISKQVSLADGNLNTFIKTKNELENKISKIEEEKIALEEAKFNFEKQMKLEYQKIEDMKIDFEQEKNKLFSDLAEEKEMLEREKRAFEKHRSEQMMLIEQNKSILTKNYRQFEEIVNNFNKKIDDFSANN